MKLELKLKPKIKTAWIKDLQENSDKQCTLNLKKDDKYCVLGSLCKIDGTNADGFAYTGCGNANEYTAEVLSQYYTERLTVEMFLMQMNDSQHLPFKDLAAWIEENL